MARIVHYLHTPLSRLPQSHPLCERADVCSRDFHAAVRSCLRIKHALHLDIREEPALCRSVRVTAAIAAGGFLAGFDATKSHIDNRLVTVNN